mmetsp:Transcript_138865/g.241598  ORF Transcript_138865/g.241598 Transcript_138865/m.241598 type:complete len:391 (-) Transcript_138865:40-1212(-)
MWQSICKTAACSVVCLMVRSVMAVERRPIMRRVERHTRRTGTHNVHVASPTSQPFEAHGPGRPEKVEMQNASHLGHGASASALSELRFDKAALFNADELLMTTPVPSTPEVVSRRPVPSMHRMFESLPLPPADGSKGRAKGSFIVESSGISAMLANTPMPAGFPGAGLMELKQGPSTTGAVVAATTAAAAAVTTPAAAGAAGAAPAGDAAAAGGDAAAAGGDAGGGAAAPADANSGGMGLGTIMAILIVAILVVLGAAWAVKTFMSKKVAGRLDGVKDSPDSQYWKSAKARQTYRKSQLSTPQAAGDDSDQDAGSGQGRGMIQQDGGDKSSSYRDRRDRKRGSGSSDRKATDEGSASDHGSSQKSSSYRGRRHQQQAKRDAAGASEDVRV